MSSQRRNRQGPGAGSDSSERRGAAPTGLRAANRQALRLLDEWLSEPDDLGDEWWERAECEVAALSPFYRGYATALPDSGMTS